MSTRAVAAAFVIALAAWAVAVALGWPARAHDPYSGWRTPANPAVSCCDNTDCRPTRAYLGDDGLWRAWNGYLWLTVPADRILPPDFAGDGRSHLCEKGTYIYCFTPGQVRG